MSGDGAMEVLVKDMINDFKCIFGSARDAASYLVTRLDHNGRVGDQDAFGINDSLGPVSESAI
jgi:hypothetical protein